MAAPLASEIRAMGIETDMGDIALQTVIDTEWDALCSVTGYDAASEHIIEVRAPYFAFDILLGQDASAIVSVAEAGAVLDPTEYTLLGTRCLRRGTWDVAQGVWPDPDDLYGLRWGFPVVVEYVPITAQRSLLIVTLTQLVKLWLAYSGYASEQGPDVGVRPLDYHGERQRILAGVTLEGWIV